MGVAQRFEIQWRMSYATDRTRIAILASREDHCLLDLLWRWRRDELEADIALVASNHPDLRSDVESFGLPYHHIPIAKDDKAAAEPRLLELLRGQADLVAVPVINIHHSFLPAFSGAGPYKKAKERGVKLIGATAHYVTEDLDAGPIIEQDVIRVTHRDDLARLARLGRDIERTVLARAVSWHCEDRALVRGNTTVVF